MGGVKVPFLPMLANDPTDNGDSEPVRVDPDSDILFLTMRRYKAFMARGRAGFDEMLLYLHLMFTARMQANHRVWANRRYLQNGLQWGASKVRSVKARLRDQGLISYDQPRAESGKVGEVYILVNMADRAITGGSETDHPVPVGQFLPQGQKTGGAVPSRKDKTRKEKAKTSKGTADESLDELREYEPGVRLTIRHYNRLVADFGEAAVKAKLAHASDYFPRAKKPYTNHYSTLRKWLAADRKKAAASSAGEADPRRAAADRAEQERLAAAVEATRRRAG